MLKAHFNLGYLKKWKSPADANIPAYSMQIAEDMPR